MPCKPRMAGCAARCLHRQLVESYREARSVWELGAEAVTGTSALGYADELADYAAQNPPPLFKTWLVDSAGRNLFRPESELYPTEYPAFSPESQEENAA